jgi:hypothetical protein
MEILVKPRLTLDDLEYWRDHPGVVRHFLDNDKPRVYVILSHHHYDKFEKAVLKKYGSIAYTKIFKAAEEALISWSNSVLGGSDGR